MSNGSIKAALTANVAIAAGKSFFAFFTGSASLLAESIHSIADCGNQLLLMWGIKSSSQEPDIDHPLGYGMNVYFWSFIVALMLFSIGGMYSLIEGISKLGSTKQIEHIPSLFIIIILGIYFEGKSLMVCLSEIKEKYPNKSIWWFIKETRSPELLVIFCEDSAAVIGLIIVSICLALSWFLGDPIYDAIGSICVGTLLIAVAIVLFLETKSLLIGQSVNPEIRRKLRLFLVEREEIEHTYEIATLQMGKEALLLIKARFKEQENVIQLTNDINEIENELKRQFNFTNIFIQPISQNDEL
jgi:cation diffusion facilitator family transporter